MTVRLVHLDLATFHDLQAGDSAAVEKTLGLTVPAELVESPEYAGIWTYMISLLDGHPENADWVMQLVIHDGAIVGNAGFKGAPVDGQAELGYSISEPYRRRGLALAAVDLLVETARQRSEVDRVVARIRPDNDASVAVVTKAGFAQENDYMNPRWGRQLQFGISTRAPEQ